MSSILSLIPTEQDMEMFRSDPKSVVFKFSNPIRNITNDKVYFQIFDGIDGTSKFGPIQNGPGGNAHSDPANATGGETTFVMTQAATKPANLKIQTTWRYEVKILPQGGSLGVDDVVAFYGKLIINPRAEPIPQV